MPSTNLTGLFPVQSAPNVDARSTTFTMGLCGEDDNVRDVMLWVNNLSGLQHKVLEDHVCYVSGTLIVSNDDDFNAPDFLLEASTVEDLGILADQLAPSTQRLANAHFIGQVTAISGAERREFGLNTGAYSAKHAGLRAFEVRLHFDDDNRRFQNFKMPRVGANLDVQAKWIRDSQSPNRSHWMIERLTYLGLLPTNPPATTASTTSPNRKRLFGAGHAASSSKQPASPTADEPHEKKRKENSGTDTEPSSQQSGITGEPSQSVSNTSAAPDTAIKLEEPEYVVAFKDKGKKKAIQRETEGEDDEKSLKLKIRARK